MMQKVSLGKENAVASASAVVVLEVEGQQGPAFILEGEQTNVSIRVLRLNIECISSYFLS